LHAITLKGSIYFRPSPFSGEDTRDWDQGGLERILANKDVSLCHLLILYFHTHNITWHTRCLVRKRYQVYHKLSDLHSRPYLAETGQSLLQACWARSHQKDSGFHNSATRTVCLHIRSGSPTSLSHNIFWHTYWVWSVHGVGRCATFTWLSCALRLVDRQFVIRCCRFRRHGLERRVCSRDDGRSYMGDKETVHDVKGKHINQLSTLHLAPLTLQIGTFTCSVDCLQGPRETRKRMLIYLARWFDIALQYFPWRENSIEDGSLLGSSKLMWDH